MCHIEILYVLFAKLPPERRLFVNGKDRTAVYKNVTKQQIEALEGVIQEARVFLDKQNPIPSAPPC